MVTSMIPSPRSCAGGDAAGDIDVEVDAGRRQLEASACDAIVDVDNDSVGGVLMNTTWK